MSRLLVVWNILYNNYNLRTFEGFMIFRTTNFVVSVVTRNWRVWLITEIFHLLSGIPEQTIFTIAAMIFFIKQTSHVTIKKKTLRQMKGSFPRRIVLKHKVLHSILLLFFKLAMFSGRGQTLFKIMPFLGKLARISVPKSHLRTKLWNMISFI